MKINVVNIVVDDDDVPYEEDILRNQFSVKAWLRYIDFKKEAPKNVINLLFERALKELPGSYILWHRYLKLRRAQVRGLCVLDPAVEDVNSAFERALVFMHKMPRIWLDYCEFIMAQCNITRTRDVFDRSLRALPITQHHRIWPLYLKFVTKKAPPETAVRVYRRYLKLCYEDTEDFIDYLAEIDRLDEASIKLAEVVNNERFVSKHGKPKHQLWNELCELISKNPEKVKSLNVDAIIRDGLRRFSDQVGHFWNCLADYYIRSGLFDRARDIYEEAINTVMTVRDFTQVFDAYSQCEESLIKVKMEEIENGAVAAENVLHLDLLMERYDYLLERRPLLLNSVLLRQNPHNVHEWHRRIKLLEGKPKEIISTYTEAVQKVDPKSACGKLHTLWVSFAKFYESHKQIDDARIIFEKAIQVSYTEVDDLASVWCEWTEMEIRHNNFETALKLMHRATAAPVHKGSYHDQSLPVQERLYKSLKVWLLYADLEEALGKFKSIKAVYDRIIDLRIATPQVIINYGLFLEENNYFEEAFKAYEKGISLFKWPNVYDIWNTYLVKFLKRYGGTKLERARDLFEQCLERCPAEFAKSIYLLYAKLEEEHGLARHAMSVYERATRAVLPKEQFEMFNIYLKKAAEIYGVTYTRQIYEKAIELLPDSEAKQMCLKFADLEKKLGEIDRSRAIYAHCSQMCDPRTNQDFWRTWKEFEVRHGNEDTMREMLRIKRSVQATYNTQVNFMNAQMLSAAVAAARIEVPEIEPNVMQNLEAQAQAISNTGEPSLMSRGKVLFVRGETTEEEKAMIEEAQASNPAEIDLDFDSDEDEKIEEIQLEERQVPDEVFGALKEKDD
ncbi:pre-mRNA-splicing factor syf1 homolog isoform X2 [Parasteatoda tepidariorum]|uniref:pre-mRNA-splicing factor syf1 homolog isoform X2 n=1 Tax=Parasteatoda tepidariorum TaxID=114398 RepID=UPI00077FD8A3|nr:pre-mRNA-splicing factor syf1 homolog isoform X2 [Parasteatoda tepidariorum]